MSDIFKSKNYLFGEYEVISSDRQPCPVCGHPTGDCIPEGHEEPVVAFSQVRTENNDTIRLVLVKEDVYITKQVSPYATSRILSLIKKILFEAYSVIAIIDKINRLTIVSIFLVRI